MPTRNQDALEVCRIFRREHVCRSRQVVICEPGEPKTQGGATQGPRPGIVLGRRQRAHRLRRIGQAGDAGLVAGAAGLINTPVIAYDRQIEDPGVDSREIEVKETT